MVNIVSLSLATIAAMAPIAMAANCQSQLYYCGYNLLKHGDYLDQILEALDDNHVAISGNSIKESYFFCTGGANGEIEYLRTCEACADGGENNSDTC
ncbi:hypothetical protein B0T10DRAFT_585375 [Thelonectria olida]|uniref:Uncharacterized protein n=1 Tax=Thelonectria olida TaxID=1576542 RepID=A0A9P8VTP1_9HYPO|nr:hypothetical protein B0T10DRAFT_585375 [Thelonectria olida]